LTNFFEIKCLFPEISFPFRQSVIPGQVFDIYDEYQTNFYDKTTSYKIDLEKTEEFGIGLLIGGYLFRKIYDNYKKIMAIIVYIWMTRNPYNIFNVCIWNKIKNIKLIKIL